MAVETVLSIVESASGNGVVAELFSMSSAEWQVFIRKRAAQRFFADLPKQIAAWTARIQQLKRGGDLVYLKDLANLYRGHVAFESAMAKLASEEAFVAHTARMAAANAAASAAEGTLVAGAGTTAAAIVLPVVAMVAVGVALGAPYYEAREEARKEGYASGFSKGFITGLLEWELRFTIERFWDDALNKNHFDEAIPTIRANAHNSGLVKGRIAGLAKTPVEKKEYLRGMRKLTRTSTAGWSPRSDDWMERMRARQVQISYVIDLMGAASKHRLISIE
ncbi:MAG TPA: hypothetical protein VJL58_05740 [Pyrinomonadaceae bacterium]|nr:hypothetical protein [Pyrinomonadaceae bacterium]